MNIANILDEKAKKFADKKAIIFKEESVTFSQLRSSAFKLASALKKIGINKSEIIAIYLPNCLEYAYSYLALWCAGATCVPLDFMLTEEEVVSCITHSQAKLLIIKPKQNISLAAIKEKCPSLKQIVVCAENSEGFLAFQELLRKGEDSPPAVAASDKDYAIIFYTSGTTGKPKGVLINYLQLTAAPKSMEFFVELKEEDIALCALPFSHTGGLIYLQNCVFYGITIVLMERFIPLEFLKNIQKYKITCFWIVPSMYYAVLQLKEFESFDLSHLRWIVTFGASSSPDALRKFNQFCPNVVLVNGWGLTETNAPTTVLPINSKKIESVGIPAPWIEVKIFDKEDKEVAIGTVGEIAVRGWVVTDGYYQDPEATKQVMRNGWFFTGDLGKFDAEKFLYIVGRKKEMIKVAGEIVFEPEVEAVIQKHPGVCEVAVVGVKDSLRGEVPKAFIALKEGSSLSEDEVRYFCREHLAHFKIPHYFEFRDALPKNRSGKIDKEQLRMNKI
ncbi:MAG: AMP-binding protein [Candidatus Omnitrophota bacterium]